MTNILFERGESMSESNLIALGTIAEEWIRQKRLLDTLTELRPLTEDILNDIETVQNQIDMLERRMEALVI